MENLHEGKAQINITAGFCEIILPARGSFMMKFNLILSVLVGPIALIFIANQVASGSMGSNFHPFFIIWLVAFGVSILFSIRKFIWVFFGKEIITTERGEMTIMRKNLWFYKPKTYLLNQIFNITTQLNEDNDFWGRSRNRNFWRGYTKGTIIFDYEMKTGQFGESISEGEARTIIHLLVQKGFIKQEQVLNSSGHVNVMGNNWKPE